LAYLQSYKNIIKRRILSSGSSLILPEFDDSSSKESIKATKDYIDLKLSEQKKNSDNQKSLLLWLVATTFTVVNFTVAFADKNLPADPNMLLAANFLKSNAYALPLLTALAFVYFVSNLIMKPRYDFKRDVVRVSFTGRRNSIILLSLLGFSFIAIGVFFWKSAFGY
jgi:hypothetical protein